MSRSAPLDIARLKRSLLPLELAVYAPPQGVVAEYLRFYGIDMEQQLPGVRHHVGYFEAYGYRLLGHVFFPAPTAAQPQAAGSVVMLHGYLDHSGLYRHLIRTALQQGRAVFIFDLPGHGLSQGARMDIADFSHYQAVLDEALQRFAADLPQPWHILGLSMGAGIVMDHLLSRQRQGQAALFRKALLLAPLLRPAQWRQIQWGWWLLRWLRRSMPRVFRRNSSDADYLRFVREDDSLQARQMPMGWIGALRRWVPYMEKQPDTDFPVLLVQGECDETVDWRYNNAYVRRHFRVEQEVLLARASHQLANESAMLRAPVQAALVRLLRA